MRALAIEEFRDSLKLALTEISRASAAAPREYRNVHYFESDIPKMEHAEVIADLPGRMVIKTLRGWIMSVPVDEATQLTQSQPQ